MVSKNTTQIASMFVEAVLYGIYLMTFFGGMSSIFLHGQDTRRIRRHWLIICAAIFLLFSSTLNTALGLVRLVQAFDAEVVYDGAVERLGNNWTNLVRTLTVSIQPLLVNAILVYRCWVVWKRSALVVIVPILLWVAGVACTISLGVHEGTKIVSSEVLGKDILRWPTIILALGITVNLYGTGMIVYKLWRMESNTASGGNHYSKLQHAMRVIIDSAMLQAIASLVMLIAIAAGSYTGGFIASAAEAQVAGIAYNLILIRIAQERPPRGRTRNSDPANTQIGFSPNPNHTSASEFSSQCGTSMLSSIARTELQTMNGSGNREAATRGHTKKEEDYLSLVA